MSLILPPQRLGLPQAAPPEAAPPETAPPADLDLAAGQVHELCGPARRTLAALVAARIGGVVLWVQPTHEAERLCPQGLARLLDPARVIGVRAAKPTEALWAAEEALRSGVAGVVVVELAAPPPLVPVRRLRLAAETGGGRMAALLLTPDRGGAAGVDSRWHAAPRRGGGWRLMRLRARMAPPAAFDLDAPGAGLVALAAEAAL